MNKTPAAEPERVSGGWAAKEGGRVSKSHPVKTVATPSKPAVSATGVNAPGFERSLDAATHSQARAGNKVTMLFDGVASFAERSNLIDAAKESINLQTFIFSSDDAGWALAHQLADKAKEGVKVRVIYDAMGSNRADAKMFEMMKAAGVEVREYGNPLTQPWDINDRWHEKHLIIDGTVSIEGGMNIANEYALGGSGRLVYSRGERAEEPWRDADVKLEGPSVNDTQAMFMRNWETVGGTFTAAERAKLLPKIEPRADGVEVRAVQHRPEEDDDQNTHQLMLQTIGAATKSIRIENAYFIPPKDLREALISAAKRGVDVQVMTNSRATNDMGMVSDASRYFYDELIAAGVKVFEKQGGTLHSKTMTVDGQYSLVGSANLNGRSKGRDSEDVLAIRDPSTAQQLEARFTSGLKQTKQVTAGELKNESFLTNLKQWSLSTLAWTF